MTMRLVFMPLLAALMICPAAYAQEVPTTPPTNGQQNQPTADASLSEIQINQPYVSKKLGTLTLPFMWTVVEDDKATRLTATQSRSDQPAVLTIDLMNVPADVDAKLAARKVIESLAEALDAKPDIQTESLPVDCGKKQCPSLDVFQSVVTGKENDVERRCAMRLVPNASQLLVLTVCAAQSQRYQPDLPDILSEVMAGMN